MELDQLPDELLLMAMEYLGVQDLIALQIVCKRLGALAQDVRVWRHQSVSDGDARLGPTLRLAPRLRSLQTSVPSALSSTLYSTKCAVSKLRLFVERDGAIHATQLIRHQEALGRLRDLHLTLFPTRDAVHDYEELIWAVASMSGLEKLVVKLWSRTNNFRLPPPREDRAVPRSSLKSLRCISTDMQPFYSVVLADHAATLEEVYLELEGDHYPAGITLQLAGMPRLRVLRCPLLPGLEAVAACGSLRVVTLCVNNEPAGMQGAKEFLRRATQLREVALRKSNTGMYNYEGEGDRLVLALVSRGPSRVESLTIDLEDEVAGFFQDPTSELGPLLQALPLMPDLRTLQVDEFKDELLLAITPASAPALRTLKEQPREADGSGCAHRFLHHESVQTLMSLNPSLNVLVCAGRFCPPEYRAACEGACAEGCHQDQGVWDNEEGSTGCWTKIPRLNPVSNE
ncbi:uncharacterized protein LOC113203684 [Frankliniella occidentalis]|uniref:Uncharacterized protein LOC113203684 n=1 Tax=Frankliniella occidentalis TaxID=133901 RepID=A0A9C6X5M9_FRAOC|nr:uncharacterized protein LOC113203684 [Frankliniella occidentalis]